MWCTAQGEVSAMAGEHSAIGERLKIFFVNTAERALSISLVDLAELEQFLFQRTRIFMVVD